MMKQSMHHSANDDNLLDNPEYTATLLLLSLFFYLTLLKLDHHLVYILFNIIMTNFILY